MLFAYPLMVGWMEVLIIALIVLLIFGASRIPTLMKNLGKGVKSFKEGLNEVEKEIKEEPKEKNEGQ